MKKQMLITGVSGLLGNNLAFCLKDSYDILGIYHSHCVEIEGIRAANVDLRDSDKLQNVIDQFKPDVIIHGAAQADVDVCEMYPEEAKAIHVVGTRNLVGCLAGSHVKLVSISTDQVYDGVKGSNSELDPVNPINHYGKTKLEAESEALECQNALVLRTNFFGWNIRSKYSLGEWLIHQLTNKRKIQGLTDCIFSSIYTFELAKIIKLMIDANLYGIYNCASSTAMSKYQFLLEIAEKLKLEENLIEPVLLDNFPRKAKRGKNLDLNVDKLAHALSIEMPSMIHSIVCFVNDFEQNVPEIIRSKSQRKVFYPIIPDAIPYGRQAIDNDDLAAVTEILKGRSLTQGPRVQEFETGLCQATASIFCVAVNSGTSALHIACLAADVGAGDEVITSPNTFVASANCVLYCGARPVFADIDPLTYNISASEIERKITIHTKAIIPVHFAGQSCDMEAIQRVVRLSEKKYGHKIYLIEDACHATGSYYKRTKVGSCAYSDMAVMSFHPVKHITTGEGGCVLTNDAKLFKKLISLRSHGITSDPIDTGVDLQQMPWYYEQRYLGFNYRITDIQCALGISQLKKLDEFRKRRRDIVNRYNDAFRDVEWIKIPFESSDCDSNFHLYVLQIDFGKLGITRAEFILGLRKKGIQTQVHYIPVHTQPYYRTSLGTNWGDFPVTESYYEKCLSFPLHPAMTDLDMVKVIDQTKALLELQWK